MSSMNNRWSGISSPIESLYAGVSADQRESCRRDARMIGADFFRVMKTTIHLTVSHHSRRVCADGLSSEPSRRAKHE
jgi:hypothetical protein